MALDLYGSASGAYGLSPTKAAPDVADDSESVVPRIYGRNWIKPPLLFARTSPGTWKSGTNLGSPGSVTAPSQRVECIWGLGQLGVTVRGIRVNGVTVGLRKNSAGSWVTEGGGDVLGALVLALSCYDATPTFVPSSPSGPYYRYDYQWAPIELITNTSAPWGKRTDGVASTTTGGVTPLPTWTDVGGASLPAWAWLEGTDAEGLAYAQVATLRCQGVPLIDGKIPDIEVLVDGVGGVDASPVDVVRDILTTLMRIPSEKVITDVGPDGATTSSFEEWCSSMSGTLKINCAVNSDPRAQIEDLLKVTCAEIVPLLDGGVRVQPYADTEVGTYVPPSTAYVVDSNDIVGDVVEVEERPQEECFNSVVVTYTDPAFPKTQAKMPHRDDLDISASQERKSPTISSEFISSAAHARFIAEHTVRKSLRNRRTWPDLALTLRFLRLEPGDLLEVHDARLPVAIVRVTKRDIDLVGGTVTVECEEWEGDTHPLDITPDVPAGLTENPQSAAEASVVANAETAATEVARQIGGGNLLRNSSMEADSNADGIPDGWAIYNNGGEACTPSIQTGGIHGGKFARLDWTVLNSSTRGWLTHAGVSLPGSKVGGVQGGWRSGQWYVVSWWMRGNAAVVAANDAASLRWNTDPTDTVIVNAPAISADWQRYVFRVRWTGSAAANGELYISMNGNVANGQLDIDAIQVEEGERETAYAPGTWDAETAAEVADGKAVTADGKATTALATLADIASDGLLTPVEKPQVIREYAVIGAEQAGIDAQAVAAGVTTERTAYNMAISTLASYLAGLTSPVAWNNLTGNTTVVGADFRTYFANVYTAKQALLNAIGGAAAASLTLGSNWGVAGLSPKVSRSFNLVAGRLSVINSEGASWDSIGTLPVGFRPPDDLIVVGRIVRNSGTRYLATFKIAATGVISVDQYDNGTNLVTPPTSDGGDGALLNFAFLLQS